MNTQIDIDRYALKATRRICEDLDIWLCGRQIALVQNRVRDVLVEMQIQNECEMANKPRE